MNNIQSAGEHLDKIRHSLAHLLAAAVLKKYPDTLLAIGPTIEDGFYYDFLPKKPFTDEDLKIFESEMRELINQNLIFTHVSVSKEEALKKFNDQPFKKELIEEFSNEGQELTLYKTGEEFIDLCKGGHVDNTKEISGVGFKLRSLAGAYWRGSEKNPQLQRIYGLAFKTNDELVKYQELKIEAEKRDHRKLGRELKLFTMSDMVGPGLPMFYPKGALLRREVENLITEIQEKQGYEPIWIPHIAKAELYKTSGHLEKYDALFPPMNLKDEDVYYLKPMNCPHFMMLYKSLQHSYRDLPIRWTCTTTNYRYEKSGELGGLTRVRALTQDDCHVFATPLQIEAEINLMLETIYELYKIFNLNDFWVRISTHDPNNFIKYIGDKKIWHEAEEILEKLIKDRGWKHEIGVGEAAFYGPKLDFIFKDALGREWQLSTIQLDMNLPKRFELEYIDSENKIKEPVLIHRAILGSTERFLGILIEHYAGIFPLWLAPIQVSILAVSEKYEDYAKKIEVLLKAQGIRAIKKQANETLGKRIRDAELEKIPFTLIVGEKEVTANTVSVRHIKKGDMGVSPIEEFLGQILDEIKSRQ